MTGYLLDTTHSVGGPKANFFISIGFSPRRPAEMERALRAQLAGAVFVGERPVLNGGVNHRFCGHILSPRKGKVLITSVWHISMEGAIPHFVTARPAWERERAIHAAKNA